jgi:hypothetical protein
MSDTDSFQAAPRPWCCPEPRCTPLHLLIEASCPTPADSFVCFGDSPEVRFEYDGVEHVNDARSCHYTPLKGLIAYQENADDWAALRSAYWRAGTALTARRQDRKEQR